MRIYLTNDKDIFTILLLSDTHIYSRREHLPEHIMRAFQDAKPDLILHCGDIYTMTLIDDLRMIAPVYAVRGNRDILNRYRLPAKIDLNIGHFRIYAEHGQGKMFAYLFMKIYLSVLQFLRRSPDYSKVVKIKKDFINYDLYCFGHSHSRFLEKRDKTILINPGHLNIADPHHEHESPSYAIITLTEDIVKVTISCIEGGKNISDIHHFSR